MPVRLREGGTERWREREGQKEGLRTICMFSPALLIATGVGSGFAKRVARCWLFVV